MKKPTLKSSVQSAFSLVELLVVIAVIAVIAAIAIPNIAGITSNAQTASDKRNAQNLASLSSAAVAAGASTTTMGDDEDGVVANLITGITVVNGGSTFGPFRADGLPTDETKLDAIKAYLTMDDTTHGLIYNPAGEAPAPAPAP